MTMIGPASPKQICPECNGEGEHYKGERMEYRPAWGILSPEHGEWVSVSVYVPCDICDGRGRVTKATLNAYRASQSI